MLYAHVIRVLYVSFAVIWTIRALTISLTIDEATTVSVASELEWSDWLSEANFHPVNSMWVYLSVKWFGLWEAGHRLLNVCAGYFYLYFAWRFGKLLGHTRGFIFCIGMIANPFLNEFFSLARGYGIALAAMTYVCYVVLVETVQSGRSRCVACSVAAGVSVYSNYAFALFILPLLLASAWRALRLRRYLSVAVAAIVAVAWGIPFLVLSLEMNERGLLYYGGRGSFISDTIGSLMDTFAYHSRAAVFFRAAGFSILAIALIVTCWHTARWTSANRPFQPIHTLACCLLTSFLLSIAMGVGSGMLFLVERTALPCYVLLLAAFSVSFIPPWRQRKSFGSIQRWVITTVACTAIVHSGYCSLKFSTYLWFWDRSNLAFVRDFLESETSARRIGVSAYAVPGIDYYLRKSGASGRVSCVPVDMGAPLFDAGIPQIDGKYYGYDQSPVDCRIEYFSGMFKDREVTDWFIYDFYEEKSMEFHLTVAKRYPEARMIWLKRVDW
jgi:hypothetical protein